MRTHEPTSLCCYRRRLLRFLLHSLRRHPHDWRLGRYHDLTHPVLKITISTRWPDQFSLAEAHAPVPSEIVIPFWWRGRIRRAARRVAWFLAAEKIL